MMVMGVHVRQKHVGSHAVEARNVPPSASEKTHTKTLKNLQTTQLTPNKPVSIAAPLT